MANGAGTAAVAVAAIVAALLFAVSTGACGTPPAFRPAGPPAPASRRPGHSRREALVLAACSLAGAALGGEALTRWYSGLVVDPGAPFSPESALIVIASACLAHALARTLGVPVSPAGVIVAAFAGTAFAGATLDGAAPVPDGESAGLDRLRLLIGGAAVTALPLLAFIIAVAARRYVLPVAEIRLAGRERRRAGRRVAAALGASAAAASFAAGMCDAAGIAGPLVAAGLFDARPLVVLVGCGLAAGALLGTRTRPLPPPASLSLLDTALVSGAAGILAAGSSLAGLPASLSQLATAGALGAGWAKRGRRGVDRFSALRRAGAELLAPAASLLLALGMSAAAGNESLRVPLALAVGWAVAALLAPLFARVRALDAVAGREPTPR